MKDQDRITWLPDTEIARAAIDLVRALDCTVPDWRETTLDQGEDGDEVNRAWDRLVHAIDNAETRR